MKARFIHRTLADNKLPKAWGLRGQTFEGCQVLGLDRAMEILAAGEDHRDDWYTPEGYTRLALFDVDSCSGDTGHLGYKAVLEGDIKEMRVIDLSDIAWDATEVVLELREDFDGLDVFRFIEEHDLAADVFSALFDEAAEVTPDFVDTF